MTKRRLVVFQIVWEEPGSEEVVPQRDAPGGGRRDGAGWGKAARALPDRDGRAGGCCGEPRGFRHTDKHSDLDGGAACRLPGPPWNGGSKYHMNSKPSTSELDVKLPPTPSTTRSIKSVPSFKNCQVSLDRTIDILIWLFSSWIKTACNYVWCCCWN